MSGLSAPIFSFGNGDHVNTPDSYVRTAETAGELSLTGPCAPAGSGTIPVRGDLAHIRLAGVHFVPHYAVPMPHTAGPDGASLRIAGKEDAELVTALTPGTEFAVIDMSGGWAWGQVEGEAHGEHGPVGYIVLSQLEELS